MQPKAKPQGSLSKSLMNGASPFKHRSGISSLLGMPKRDGSCVVPSVYSIPFAFRYAELPRQEIAPEAPSFNILEDDCQSVASKGKGVLSSHLTGKCAPHKDNPKQKEIDTFNEALRKTGRHDQDTTKNFDPMHIDPLHNRHNLGTGAVSDTNYPELEVCGRSTKHNEFTIPGSTRKSADLNESGTIGGDREGLCIKTGENPAYIVHASKRRAYGVADRPTGYPDGQANIAKKEGDRDTTWEAGPVVRQLLRTSPHSSLKMKLNQHSSMTGSYPYRSAPKKIGSFQEDSFEQPGREKPGKPQKRHDNPYEHVPERTHIVVYKTIAKQTIPAAFFERSGLLRLHIKGLR